jgi:hypothetical protein
VPERTPRVPTATETASAWNPGAAGAPLLKQAEDAFVNGLSSSLLVGAGVLFGASLVVALIAPRREEVAQPDTVEATQQPVPSPVGE